MMTGWLLWVAQGFGLGRIPFAPGTFGSLGGLLWFAVLLRTGRLEWYLALTGVGLALGVWLCGLAEKTLRQQDPSSVVWDELAVMPICFLPLVMPTWIAGHALPPVEAFFTGRSWWMTVVVFGLFRLFDIWKPWPVGQSQRLPGGWGVMTDDFLASIYVALIGTIAVTLG